MRHDPYRWKSFLVMKGEVVTHQLDCAVAGSAASALTSPAFVAAMSVVCSSCAWLPPASPITIYFVKAHLLGRPLGGALPAPHSLPPPPPPTPPHSFTPPRPP